MNNINIPKVSEVDLNKTVHIIDEVMACDPASITQKEQISVDSVAVESRLTSDSIAQRRPISDKSAWIPKKVTNRVKVPVQSPKGSAIGPSESPQFREITTLASLSGNLDVSRFSLRENALDTSRVKALTERSKKARRAQIMILNEVEDRLSEAKLRISNTGKTAGKLGLKYVVDLITSLGNIVQQYKWDEEKREGIEDALASELQHKVEVYKSRIESAVASESASEAGGVAAADEVVYRRPSTKRKENSPLKPGLEGRPGRLKARRGKETGQYIFNRPTEEAPNLAYMAPQAPSTLVALATVDRGTGVSEKPQHEKHARGGYDPSGTKSLNTDRESAREHPQDKDWNLVRKKKKRSKPAAPIGYAEAVKSRPTNSAVRVICKDKGSFAEILKTMREKVNPTDLGIGVQAIRQTREGNILIEMQEDK